MRMPSVTASTSVWVRVVTYLIARLTRNRETRELVRLIQPALDALRAAASAMERADDALTVARAQYDGADDDLDEVIPAFEGELLLSVGKQRKAAAYQKCFPDGLVAVTGAKVADQMRLVKTREGTIHREMAGTDLAERYLARITAAREEMERHIPLLQKAMDDVAAAWSTELAARHDLRRQYRIVFAELIKLFPENMRKVNSFFRDPGPGRRAAGDDESGEELVPPAPAPPAPPA